MGSKRKTLDLATKYEIIMKIQEVLYWAAGSLQEAEWHHMAQDCRGESDDPVWCGGTVVAEGAQNFRTVFPMDVYNADETGLLYNLMPDRTLAVKGDTCKVGKRSKERLTVILCANMDGSDNVMLMAVGKLAKPCDFERNIVPCRYDSNKKAWMTGDLSTK
ncbi:hypothetical protein PR048_002081 [Dryococelus australis]|uniref:DDE-1 domain-containing protein n=1 Tax=Dryococelus australis TaxID=614101 RepID=A0ABQ9IKB5_9NEOP|nr:hypothetical protein PR048_002081 [Dryococelus australis]